MYEKYKSVFNKRFAVGVGGGGIGVGMKRGKRVTRKKQRGGDRSDVGIFHKLTNEVCVRPWKK